MAWRILLLDSFIEVAGFIMWSLAMAVFRFVRYIKDDKYWQT